MTRSIRGSRRATLLLAGAAATLLLASGCGSGQVSETANKVPGVPGLNVELRTPDGGFYKVRNLNITYPGMQGYPAGGNAPIEVAIFNDTDAPVTVTVSSDEARSVVLSSGAEATPANQPARVEIPVRSFVTFNSDSDRQLLLVGLTETRKTGQTIKLVFDFNGEQIPADAPVMVPLTAVPVAPPVVEGEHE